MVIPDHLVHAVEVPVELYDDVLAGVAACDADGRHRRFRTGVKKPELFDRGNELGKVFCKLNGLGRVVVHEKALFYALLKSSLNAGMLMAEHGRARTAVIVDKLLIVDGVKPCTLGVVNIVRHTAGDINSAAGGNAAGHIFLALFPKHMTFFKLHFRKPPIQK